MKKGDRVKYIGCSEAQYQWGSGDDPRKIFKPELASANFVSSQELIIESMEVHSHHTLIKFRGIDGKFNSVCFRGTKDGK